MCAVTHAQLVIRVQARARRDELVTTRDGTLIARVSAPALAGRANRALCRLIARRLRIAPSRVVIVRGERSRDKLVRIEGIDAAAVRDILGQ